MSESNKCCDCNQGELPCTCPCHSTTPSSTNYLDARTPEERARDAEIEVTMTSTGPMPSATPSWEEEFDMVMQPFLGSVDGNKAAKAFIQYLLGRQREEMVALGEGLKREVRTLESHPNEWVECMSWEDEAYNQAITTYQSLLAKK